MTVADETARRIEAPAEKTLDFRSKGQSMAFEPDTLLTVAYGSDIIPMNSSYEADIPIPFGVGAKAKDVLVRLPNGDEVPLIPGTSITKVEIIGGKGRTRKIDEIDVLLLKYPESTESEWQKKKGIGYVEYNGESFRAEIHFYEEPTVGRVRYKLKPDAGGNWFYED